MSLPPTSNKKVGVIGAGSFGTTVANLLAQNQSVLLYDRSAEKLTDLAQSRRFKDYEMAENIAYTNDLEKLTSECRLIFPVIPSQYFRSLLADLGPYLTPGHSLIHAIKGLDVSLAEGESLQSVGKLSRNQVKTMSELIRSETMVARVGCVAGPNLAGEIAEGMPAATVVASPFDQVISEGKAALRSSNFRVHASQDILGIELAGVLKNVMAIASGILGGLGYGDNTRALLITRGLAEMANIGKKLGADPRAFLGLAGVGDLVATCYSPRSRNYTVGYRLAKGETLEEITASMEEVAEGVKTVCIVKALASHYRISAPISQALFRTLFDGMEIERGMRLLMEFPFSEDVDYI
ncbi:MAG: NAD(P)H-dependent glycerol-3-phosphate dehydrogenase [Bacteroidota bacterium]